MNSDQEHIGNFKYAKNILKQYGIDFEKDWDKLFSVLFSNSYNKTDPDHKDKMIKEKYDRLAAVYKEYNNEKGRYPWYCYVVSPDGMINAVIRDLTSDEVFKTLADCNLYYDNKKCDSFKETFHYANNSREKVNFYFAVFLNGNFAGLRKTCANRYAKFMTDFASRNIFVDEFLEGGVRQGQYLLRENIESRLKDKNNKEIERIWVKLNNPAY